MERNDRAISVFSDTFDLKNIFKEPTSYKNPNQHSCIDIILTYKLQSFQHSCAIEKVLSDFDKMTVTVVKTFFKKPQPRVGNYRDYKYFENERSELIYCQN